MNASTLIRPPRHLSRREAFLVASALLLLLLGLLAPGMTGPAASTFSDIRSLGGLPNALDVLSNLPFLVLGLLGLQRLHQLEHGHDHRHMPGVAHEELPDSSLDCAWLFFAGLVLVSAGSAFYHLQPDDVLRLAGDRAAMAVAFAGVIGLAVSDRVSQRAGWPAACVALAGGLLAVAAFHETGNVTPWAVVQFGGMVLVVVLAMLQPVPNGARAMHIKLGWLIAAYALAKVLELADGAVFEFSGHLVSGHSLKHVVAALAALPVLSAVRHMAHRPVMHNRPTIAVTV